MCIFENKLLTFMGLPTTLFNLVGSTNYDLNGYHETQVAMGNQSINSSNNAISTLYDQTVNCRKPQTNLTCSQSDSKSLNM